MKCIEDEIPFELPDNWVWCRLGTISSAIQYGLSNSAEQTGTHRLLRITDIQNGNVNWNDVPFTTVENADDYLLNKGDIVFARTGATVGKSFLIRATPFPAVYASYLIRIRLLGDIIPEYVYHFFNSQCYWEQITDKSVGVGQPNCNGTSLKELFIPLPPLSQQKLIVPTADSVLNYILSIEADKDDLKATVSSLKSQILDLAIRGKLVPQNPDDEPASILLERIRAEKEELITQGKIKRDKKESVIFKGEDNSYYEKVDGTTKKIDAKTLFDIPENWHWERLGNISTIARGGSPRPIEDYLTTDENGINWIKIGDAEQGGKYIYHTKEKIKHAGLSKTRPVKSGDFLLTNSMSFGRPYILKTDGCIHDGWLVIGDIKNVFDQDFLYYALSSDFMYNSFAELAAGSTVKNLKSDTVRSVLFPVPPLEEQKRISQHLDKLFYMLTKIEQSLN